jgi:hypothetical protein
MVHTPGVIAWAVNGYRFHKDRGNMLNVLTESYNLTVECADALLSGKVEYKVVGDVVEFEYDGVAVA